MTGSCSRILPCIGLLICWLVVGNAMIVNFQSEPIPSASISWMLLGMHQSSYISVNFSFVRNDVSNVGHVELLLFHEKDLAYVGIHLPYTVLLCCDRRVLKDEECTEDQVGYTALTTAAPRHVLYKLAVFEANSATTSVSERLEINRTGLHYVLVVNCNESAAGDVLMSGVAEWRNPSGHLPGSDVSFIPFYLSMSCCYGLGLILWCALLLWRRQHVVLLQLGVAALLLVGALAALFTALELDGRNASGVVCIPCALVAVFCATLHATLLRFFALAVALGLSIVVAWWDLETPRRRLSLFALTGAYFTVSFVQGAVSAFSEISDSSGRKSVFLLLPLNILNSCFFVWIFLELVRTIHTVRDDGDRDKYRQYVSHLLFLFSAAGAALLFYIIQLLVQWRNASDSTWTFEWMLTGAWDILLFGILIVFCILWWPSEFVKSLAYRAQEPLEWRRPNANAEQQQQQQQQQERDIPPPPIAAPRDIAELQRLQEDDDSSDSD